MIIGVIEWSSDSGEDPCLFVGDSVEAVRRAVVEFLAPMAAESINYIDHDWMAEFPAPDLDDAAAVSEWLEALRAQTTDAWLTLYGSETDVGDSAYVVKYKDVRTAG